MSYYEYRVVPAPTAIPRIKGVKGTDNLFALGLEEALNAEGQDAWEYQRSETLTATAKRGLFRKTVPETVTVLIYRRWVEDEDVQVQTVQTAQRAPRPDEPQTPEVLAAELDQTDGGPPAPVKTPSDADRQTSRGGPSLSATRQPQGDLRPVPGAARD